MTAMSAPRSASGTPSIAIPTAAADLALVRLPGSARTYELRDVLRGEGLRWDPISHAWHGTLTPARKAFLEQRLRLRPRSIVPIEAFQSSEEAGPRPSQGPRGPPGPVRPPVLSRDPSPRPRDGSRTHLEARIAFPGGEEQEELDPPTATRRFSLLEITSGLPDDSREAEEREEERRVRDLRGRVKATRAALSAVPGGQETMLADSRREAAFLARRELTQVQMRQGVPTNEAADWG